MNHVIPKLKLLKFASLSYPTVYIIMIRPGAHHSIIFYCMYPLYELLYEVQYWTVN